MNFCDGRLVGENESLRFQSATGGVDLVVDPAHRDALKGHVGEDVVFGIRPENLLENEGQVAVAGRSLTAMVEVVEPMGAETHLYLEVGGATFVARITGDKLPAENAAHVLDVNMAKAHFFDPRTEERIV